jgi:hypothetical protein
MTTDKFKKFEDWFCENIYEPDDDNFLIDLWEKIKACKCFAYMNYGGDAFSVTEGQEKFLYGTEVQVRNLINIQIKQIISDYVTLEVFDIVTCTPIQLKIDFK